MSERVAIFGGGLSGQGARRLARAKGLSAALFDENGRGDSSSFDAEAVAGFDRFVFSPGFPEDHPWRRLCEASSKICCSEIAFAATYWKGRLIGVTGTNGKTTTTQLLQQALACAGEISVAAGNIGHALSEAVLAESNQLGATAIVEISSFQAELAEGLELDALIWTNFAEDHLDRYSDMQSYFAAKAHLLDCLRPEGICVVGPQAAEWIEREQGDLGSAIVADERIAEPLVSTLAEDSVFKRPPFVENFTLAANLWHLLDQPADCLIEAANAFDLADHRLSLVTEIGGVRFWNDSKATNFHAALAALKSIDGPIVWIGGGQSKGGDLNAFAEAIAPSLTVAVLYGEVAEALAEALSASMDSVHTFGSFKDAVMAAAEHAFSVPDSNVLLSPGFASFDQFSSYGARGKTFIDMVLGLKRADELQ